MGQELAREAGGNISLFKSIYKQMALYLNSKTYVDMKSEAKDLMKSSSYGGVTTVVWQFRRIATTCTWHESFKPRREKFPTRSDSNRPVQSQKQARSLKFRISEEEKLYYPYSENKGADQLRSHCEADLCLRFRIVKNPVFSQCDSF